MNRAEIDDMGFDGRAAIVTGGGAEGEGIGNGRAVSILLARAGARVMVADLDGARAEETVHMIRDEGGVAASMKMDVTDPIQCRDLVKSTVAKFGRLDFLDNNVGVTAPGNVVDIELESWRRVMQINLDSMMLMSKYAIPAMIDTAQGGAIVNIASVAAINPSGRVAYTASKGAVISLTRAMALDHGKDAIRVNCIIPGAVFTPLVVAAAVLGPPTAEERERKRQLSVLGVEGDGWDTAHAVRFFLSRHARFITGQSLVVDGGTTLPDPRYRRAPIPLNNLSRSDKQ